jgi:hypothetical protein
MRWKHSKKIGPNLHDERFIQTFLLFPRRIEDETRWLERSKMLVKLARIVVGKKLRINGLMFFFVMRLTLDKIQ